MATFYGENIIKQNNYNYNNARNSLSSNNYYTYDLGTYSFPNYNTATNGYSTNTYSYLTENKNIYQKTQPISYGYITNAPYSTNTIKYVQATTEYPKQYQTLTSNNYKNYQQIPITNGIFNNNPQPKLIQRSSTVTAVKPIKKYNAVIQNPHPQTNFNYNFDRRSYSAEKKKEITKIYLIIYFIQM